MLVFGAQFGFLCGAACRALLPDLNIQPEGFAIVGIGRSLRASCEPRSLVLRERRR
jgi:hypothetical protein